MPVQKRDSLSGSVHAVLLEMKLLWSFGLRSLRAWRPNVLMVWKTSATDVIKWRPVMWLAQSQLSLGSSEALWSTKQVLRRSCKARKFSDPHGSNIASPKSWGISCCPKLVCALQEETLKGGDGGENRSEAPAHLL
eukprot:4732091-Amphidinium_carterae.2